MTLPLGILVFVPLTERYFRKEADGTNGNTDTLKEFDPWISPTDDPSPGLAKDDVGEAVQESKSGLLLLSRMPPLKKEKKLKKDTTHTHTQTLTSTHTHTLKHSVTL